MLLPIGLIDLFCNYVIRGLFHVKAHSKLATLKYKGPIWLQSKWFKNVKSSFTETSL